METLTLQNFKVQTGVLIWILTLSLAQSAYLSSHYYPPDSGESLDRSPFYRFESRKTNPLKRQANYLQNLEDVPTETPDVPDLILDEPANYEFEYKVHGGGNFLGHSESRLHAQTKGSYHALLPDGRMQIVSYYADETGYHPSIKYEIVNPESKMKTYGNDIPAHRKIEDQDFVDSTNSNNKLRKRYASRIVKRVRQRRRFDHAYTN